MNNKIIKLLEIQMKKYKMESSKYFKEKNTKEGLRFRFKAAAIQKGINTIIKYGKKLKSSKDIAHLNGIGKGLCERIDEILESGTLKNVESNSKIVKEKINLFSKKDKVIELFRSITGVGDSRANTWYNSGIRSLSDIKTGIKSGKLKSTHHIDIGLKYYADFKKRIPRNEIKKTNLVFKKILKVVDKDLTYKICGSYRRKLQTSGDIDIIITNPKVSGNIHKKKYLSKLVNKSIECGFIIDNLTSLGEKKYMGVCKLGKIARRIDIRCFNRDEYITALIYFTGSRNFNIYLRNTALKQGYMLNEYYLMKKEGKKKIYLRYEKELFEILGIKYVNPRNRNI
jgi:DNA polymerase beta